MKFFFTFFVLLMGLFISVESFDQTPCRQTPGLCPNSCANEFPNGCGAISFQLENTGITHCEDKCTQDDCCKYILTCSKLLCPNGEFSRSPNNCNRGQNSCSFDFCNCPQGTCGENFDGNSCAGGIDAFNPAEFGTTGEECCECGPAVDCINGCDPNWVCERI